MSAERRDGRDRAARIIPTVRKCFRMVPHALRWRWAVLIPLTFVASTVEAGAAAAVFALIRLISDPAHAEKMTLMPRLSALFGWHSAQSRVLGFAALVAVYYLFKNTLVLGMQYFRQQTMGESVAELKSAMLRGYLAAPYTFHCKRNSAELIWASDTAVDGGFNEAMNCAALATSEALTAASITGVLLFTDPQVTLVAGGLLIVMLVALLRGTRRMAERYGKQKHDLSRQSLHTLKEALGAVKEIKALGREEYFSGQFAQNQHEILRLGYLGKSMEAIAPVITETVFVCGALLVIALVSASGKIGTTGLPVLALFAYAAFRIVPSANRITWRLNVVRGASHTVDSLYSDYTLVVARAAAPSVNGTADIVFNDRIVLDRVSFAYPEGTGPVLRDISMTIRCGESIGIVGSTGAGKSTIADLLVGLLQPTSGRILIDGADLQDHLTSWKRHIGYVPQMVFLTDASVRRNVALGIPDDRIDEGRLGAAVEMAQLETVVKALPNGLDTEVGERGIRLSGGERQRIGIARSLYNDPSLLVFDEATSALDTLTEAEVTRAIESLHGMKTMVVVAHRLSTVRRCDRLVMIAGGRITASGTYDELIRDSAEFRNMVTASDRDRTQRPS